MLTMRNGRVSLEDNGTMTKILEDRELDEREGQVSSEYSLDEITKKILGNKDQFAPQEEEIDISDVSIAPSAKTMRYTDGVVASGGLAKSQAVVSNKAKQVAQIRIALISFAIIVLALALTIVFLSGSVSQSFADSLVLQQTQAAAADTIAEMTVAVGMVNDMEMMELARQAGYSVANESNTHYYQMPQMRDAQTFNIERNWFDKLCDSISGAFGGK